MKQELLKENSKTALSSTGDNAYLYPKNKCLCLSHFILILNSLLLIRSADNLCKLFGPRPGQTKHLVSEDSFELLDTHHISGHIFLKSKF